MAKCLQVNIIMTDIKITYIRICCIIGSFDIFLMKYDSFGALLWTRQTGTTTSDYGYGVAVSGDGSIFVTGYTAGALNGQVSAGEYHNN